MKIKILFVCHGNICRSPSAEAIMKHIVEKENLTDLIHCDSAGIIGYHEGENADARMMQHAKKRNYNLTSISRPVVMQDFDNFDYIIGMDKSNIIALMRKAPDEKSKSKIKLMTDYCSTHNYTHVPDPYYGGSAGFELVLDLLEDACLNLLEEVKTKLV